MPKKNRPSGKPVDNTPKFNIDKLIEENNMGIHYILIQGIKREEKLPNGYKITKKELLKLIEKHYGGK